MKFRDLNLLEEEFLLQVNYNFPKMYALKARIFVEKFNEIVEGRMYLWHFGDSFRKSGVSFLIGVCPMWNRYDAYLLDCLNESLKKKPRKETIYVCDLDALESFEDLPKIFGNIEPKDTPTLGIWNEGILKESLWGWDAKNFLIEKFDFEWQPPKINYNYQ